ncbi:MAG: PDZ domain-containing protein, partial [Alphaproteobacteria bacterium]|nr:PDZ domain-containing protein [Alphaproteobacteria bacterium]
NMAALIAEAAERGGEVVRPWFGAHLQELDVDLARNLKLDVPRGALVTDLAPGGPAEAAGFQPGDVIVGIDGKSVDDAKAFSYRLATKALGGTAQLTVMRKGAAQTLELALMASPADDPSLRTTITANTVFSGITAAELIPALAEELGLPYDATGVVVVAVAENSRAGAVGFRAGDIILGLNGSEIHSKDDFARLAAGNSRNWQIVFQRDGNVNKAYLSG